VEVSKRLFCESTRYVEPDHDDAGVERGKKARIELMVQDLQIPNARLRRTGLGSPDRPTTVGAVPAADEFEAPSIDHEIGREFSKATADVNSGVAGEWLRETGSWA
jgi:hypothetical protein